MPYTFRTVNGLQHVVLSAEEWRKKSPDYTGIVGETSRLHTEFGWPIGTKTSLALDNNVTCLCPVIIEG
jgi:hypothetical protein